jgi:hypothetical protein
MAAYPPFFIDSETPFNGGDYLSASTQLPFREPKREVMRLMSNFAVQAVAEGWNSETAFEAFEELLDEHNDGLDDDERLYTPRFHVFEATFDFVAAADAALRKRRVH